MDEYLGATQDMGARDLGIDDLLAGDRGEVADFGPRDRKDAVDAVDVEVARPHIVRRRREHRIETAVAQDDVARRCDDKARLEIQAGEVGIEFVSIARDVWPAIPIQTRTGGSREILRLDRSEYMP